MDKRYISAGRAGELNADVSGACGDRLTIDRNKDSSKIHGHPKAQAREPEQFLWRFADTLVDA